MKKIFSKFWGVALVVMMLSSLIIVSAPAAADNYAFGDSFAVPGSVIDVSNTLAPAGNGFIDVAESNDVIYAIGMVAANTLYKSTDGGATWAAAGGVGLPATGLWKYVAVAPDDPLIVVVIDNVAGFADVVYLSTNGGATFAALNPLAPGTEINTVDISPMSTFRYIAVGGSSAAAASPILKTWTLGGFAWSANIVGLPACDDVVAIKYPMNFASEEDLLVVTETVNVNMTLHIYSYPSAYNGWDNAAVDPSYPRILEAAATLVVNRAVIELDDTFFALANEIGFVGASITGPAAAEIGGVYTVANAQIFTATGVNSLAWDGVNLMVAPYILANPAFAPLTIYRSSTALAATPVFSPSAAFKTPGTGTLPLVVFSGGNGYCFSQGANSAIAETTDLGATFNGIKLVNSTFGDMIDFWVKSDASAMYAMTQDAVSFTNVLWERSAGVWTRILIFTGANYGINWLVRAADSDTNAIFLARKGARNVVYSLNGGSTWTTRFSQQNIADIAAASASAIYYVSDTGATGAVFKGTVGASSIAWLNVGALTAAARLYSITLVDGGFVVGALNGVVGYYNGTTLTPVAAFGAAPVVVTASGTATGDTIYAASNGLVAGFGSWTIGTSTAWTAIVAAVPCTGVAYANGVAYAFNDVANSLYRFLPGAGLDTIVSPAAVFDQTNMVNALQITTGSNTLWARDAKVGLADTINSYTEFLLTAMPSLTYPVDNAIIPVNSLNGAINAFNFQWASPAVVLPAAPAYTLFISYDAVGALPLNGAGTAVPAGVTNLNSAPFTGAFTPGTTYYWAVQITGPIKSLPTARGSFTIQQLAAIVPVIKSPVSGSNVATLIPAFSWEPIAGVTMYEFQLAKEPEFALMVYSANGTTSSAALPVATRLEDGKTYFWRVRAVAPAVGDWSEVGIFTVAIPVPTTPAPTITPTYVFPTPTITLPQPTVTVVIPTTTPAPVEKISPAYIWAIIIIGAVLVIAVIVLIVRTRRSV